MTQPLFSLTTREIADRTPPVVVVEANGEVDAANAAEFTRAIDAIAGPRPLVVDISGLDYIDSAGFAAVDRMLSRQAITVVLDPNSPIRAAAKLIELPSLDSVEDALP
ncbi:MAG TPA: STAS domain-containing protein [Candidatus Limnocylindrales bacterium]|nr:STAS domain-containing protein [Candidatus Limnocylindrales bacterium]